MHSSFDTDALQYMDGDFFPHEKAAALSIGTLVECLFPFTGQEPGDRGKSRRSKQAPLPRLIDLAACVECDVMLAAGDPDGDGLWPLATPTILATLPSILARTGQAKPFFLI